MQPWIVNLAETEAGEPGLVGGKAAALARMARAGLPVPEAFVVTRTAFRHHLPDARPERPPASPPSLQERLLQDLEAALAATFPAACPLVVRSSALAEDSAVASFAGQHATYYYVAPDSLAAAVVDCWLSLWSPEALRYRQERADDAPFGMAVIVQRMVQPERSGVCFTRDPTGRADLEACIEAIWGLGAALVDGRVSPDRWMLARDGTVLRRQIGRKQFRVAGEPHRETGERLEPVPAERQRVSVLSDADARRVLEHALRAEQIFEAPQDVEWAWQAERLYLLQSRPIPPVVRPPVVPGRWVLFKPLAENFTDPLTPMAEDLFRRVLPPVGRFVDGYYYIDLELARRLCPFRWSTAALVDVLLLRGKRPALQPAWWKLPLLAAGGLLLYLLDGIAWHRSARLTRRDLSEFSRVCNELARSPRDDALGALQRLILGRWPLEPLGRRAYYVNVSAGRYFLLLGALHELLRWWAPDVDPHVVNQLCSGDGETLSRELVESVMSLAAAAKQDQVLREQLATAPAEELALLLRDLDVRHPFAVAMAEFLARFGHRCMREMELSAPRWREDPQPLLLMVRGHSKAPESAAQDTHARTLVARDILHRALRHRSQRRLVDYLLARIRYYVSLREDTRHYHAMAMDVTRNKLLDMEQRLLARNVLRLPGDIFFLTWAEARDLESGDLDWRDVSDRIRQRRRRQRRLARQGPPETLGIAAAELVPRPSEGSDTLTGDCASPGTAEGRVRIVLDPATAQDLEAGDILVAPYTDPAWTPLFPLAGAVVVEIGSFLSHAGTVAREYGIPCLVDVADCTRKLRDGQRVRVLASEGRLEVCGP